MPRNLCMFRGNLTRDPEVRNVGDKVKAKFSIAVNGFKKDDVEFVDCEAWGKDAEYLRDTIVKGDQVDITSRMKTERWNDKATGDKRQRTVYTIQTVDGVKVKKWNGGNTDDEVEDDPKPAKRKKVDVSDDDDYDPEEKIQF